MSSFLKKTIVFLGIITAVTTTANLVTPAPAYAENFLGMPSWNEGVDLNGAKNQNQLIKDIVKIATNILTDLTVIAAYLVLGYVIYGAYLYMFSSGDSAKVANGKKTLQHAFIGLAIVGSAYTIFSGIRIALIGNTSLGSCDPLLTTTCVTGEQMITNLIQWLAGMTGAVAAIFLVMGGWGYITSAGDPGKLEKAKKTILYALIGLVVFVLAEVITAFVSSIIRDANESTSFVQTTETIKLNKENIK